MKISLDPEAKTLEKFRPYLKILAQGKLLRRSKARFDESDIAQKVILAAHENRNKWDGDSVEPLKAWLRTILNNILINELKHDGQQKRDINKEIQLDNTDLSIKQLVTSLADSPSERFHAEELGLIIDQIIDELPRDQKVAFILIRLEQEPSETVAKLLERSPEAVGGLLRRAMSTLKEKIQPYL